MSAARSRFRPTTSTSTIVATSISPIEPIRGFTFSSSQARRVGWPTCRKPASFLGAAVRLRSSVDSLDRSELLFGQADPAQHVQNEVGLAEHVAVDVVGEQPGEVFLQLAILTRGVW